MYRTPLRTTVQPNAIQAPNYETFFGDENYYSVEAANSVLSPAAYLVDLLKNVNKFISVSGTAVSLNTRRPDIQETKLDENSTNSPVSKIRIVNGVITTAINNPDLRTLIYPFNLPYNASAASIRAFLARSNHSRQQIRNLLDSSFQPISDKTNALELLGITGSQWSIYSTKAATNSLQNGYYGLATTDDPVQVLTAVDVFTAQTGLSFSQTSDLLFEDLSDKEIESGINNSFYINNTGETNKALSFSPDYTAIQHLRIGRLDHINRFVRLAQALNWSFSDLDWTLNTIRTVTSGSSNPVSINDAILPCLAAIYEWSRTYGLSINQCCSLLGTMKVTGKKNGLSFFESIFENPQVLNGVIPPSVTTWTIPSEGTMPSSTDQVIQNILTASLQISPTDLQTLALLILGNPELPATFPLTPQNLAVLYRLKLLTGMFSCTVKELLIASDLTVTRASLVATDSTIIKSIHRLSELFKWLAGSSFTLYQVQFILSGASADPAVQNVVIGVDAVKNFAEGLNSALEKVLVTESSLFQANKTTIQQVFAMILADIIAGKDISPYVPGGNVVPRFLEGDKTVFQTALLHSFAYAEEINANIFTRFQQAGFIDGNGVVTALLLQKGQYIEAGILIAAVFMDVITRIASGNGSGSMSRFAEPLLDYADPIIQTLDQFYVQQQKACVDNLATLYKIPAPIANVLKIWCDLNLGKLTAQNYLSTVSVPSLVNVVYLSDLSADVSSIQTLLQKAQQAVVMISGLQLSESEASFFKNNYKETSQYPITLDVVQTLQQFRKLVVDFGDTQNNLITILGMQSGQTTDAQKLLALLTGWTLAEIEFIGQSLVFESTEYAFSVDTIRRMQLALGFSVSLGVDLPTLFQLIAGPADDESNLAFALWSGLSKNYGFETALKVQGKLDESLRNRLVPLAMVHFGFYTRRALTEYLLIDVEVSSQLQTSAIREAIGAVQVYVHRCINNMETGASIDPNFVAMWSWMGSFSEWVANREVFLYPETFLQPELRPGKTNIFAELEDDLKQADMTKPENIEAVFMAYMNSFTEQVQLRICGISSHDVSDGNVVTRELCMIGTSVTPDNKFYYRISRFLKTSPVDKFEIESWGQWNKLNIQVKPAKFLDSTTGLNTVVVNPVFAFGRWYMFWVEQQQSGSTTKGGSQMSFTGAGEQTPTYSAVIQYTYLDFNKNCVAPLTLTTVPGMAFPDPGKNESVAFPFFSNSIQAIIVLYAGTIMTISQNPLVEKLMYLNPFTSYYPFVIEKNLNSSVTQPFQFRYFEDMGNSGIPLSYPPGYSFACWFNLEEENNLVTILPYLNVKVGIGIFCFDSATPVYSYNIDNRIWYHIAVVVNTTSVFIYLNGSIVSTVPFQASFTKVDNYIYFAQEMLQFGTQLSAKDISGLYQNSLGKIVSEFNGDATLVDAFPVLPPFINVLMQPNWWVVSSKNADYLIVDHVFEPYLESFRLNSSTAITLGALLHQTEGIGALLSVSAQRIPDTDFLKLDPITLIFKYYPPASIDFSKYNSLNVYYWELFFHAPLLIANQLSVNQQFLEAQQWYNYIFNPAITKLHRDDDNDASVNDMYWRFIGLRESHNEHLKAELGVNAMQSLLIDLNDPLENDKYESDPFDPQQIARLRPIAFQKNVVMNYVANIISRGDSLFRQNTRESIDQAEQFYLQANDLLGEQPIDLGPMRLTERVCFNQFNCGFFQGSGWTDDVVLSLPVAIINYVALIQDHLYVCTTKGLFKSDNAGLTFVNISNGITTQNLRCIAAYDDTWYLGGDQNLVFSSTDGVNWNKLNTIGSGTELVNSIAVFRSVIYVATSDGLQSSSDGGQTFIVVLLQGLAAVVKLYMFDEVLFILSADSLWVMFSDGVPIQASSFEFNILVKGKNAFFGSSAQGVYMFSYNEITSSATPILDQSNVTMLVSTPGAVYCVASGQSGIWQSVDDGINWTQPQTDFSSLTVVDLKESAGSVYLVTDGTAALYILSPGNSDWFKAFIPPAGYKLNSVFPTYSTVILQGTDTNNNPVTWNSLSYFGIPQNGYFLDYWNTIQSRLYNIRNGLDINGLPDLLPLFEPAADPNSLVNAAASGDGTGNADNSQSYTIPYYRFATIIGKAKEVVESVAQLGQSLLSALEKKDAEILASLYSSNRQNILQLTIQSRMDQISAVSHSVQALQATLQSAKDRLQYYQSMISNGLSAYETKQISLQSKALEAQTVVEGIRVAAIIGYSIPNIYGLADGGMQFGDAINQGGNIAEGIGSLLNQSANLAATIGGYQRRSQDWQLQAKLASDEINQLNIQIVGSQYQLSVAQQELVLLQKDIDQENKVANFFLKKFTNAQLYQWYTGKVGVLYFQAYQLAQELAMQAENAWNFEHVGRVEKNTGFIRPGYWNSLYEGLLAGESLRIDLQRMDKAFYDQNERRLEIQKTISLAQLQPEAIYDLRTNGNCIFDFTEKLFDFDYPGHYCRQIKTLTVSLPMVISSYQNIHATLTQLSNTIITEGDGANAENAVAALLDKSFTSNSATRIGVRPNQQVVLSQGVNDTGMFIVNMQDERYLPFEGTGAVSSWMLEMPKEDNNFDFNTISDVIFQLSYTALQGSQSFKKFVQSKREPFNGSHVMYLSQIPGWQAFSKQTSDTIPLDFILRSERLRANMASYTITAMKLYTDNIAFTTGINIKVSGQEISFSFSNGIGTATMSAISGIAAETKMSLAATAQPSGLNNLWLIIDFTCTKS